MSEFERDLQGYLADPEWRASFNDAIAELVALDSARDALQQSFDRRH